MSLILLLNFNKNALELSTNLIKLLYKLQTGKILKHLENPDESKKSHSSCGCDSCGMDFNTDKGHDADDDHHGHNDNNDRYEKLIIGISGASFAAGLVVKYLMGMTGVLPLILFAIAAILPGYGIAKSGILSLFRRRVTINLLMVIASIGAFLTNNSAEGAAVIFLFGIAEFLERYASKRANRSLASLLKLAPDIATLRRDGVEHQVRAAEVQVGETILIKPGEKVPLDGIVSFGESTINQAAITGESVPVTKSVNDSVYAGTLNLDGYLEVKVTKKSDQTMVSKIVKLVQEARLQKSSAESFVDTFAKYYTPSIVVAAAIVALVPTLIFGQNMNEWIYKALVLLVVACPCALAISTPVSIVSAITGGAKNGVLIKGGKYIEQMKKVKAIAFDKTGTLTEGKFMVTDVTPLATTNHGEVLSIAAALESISTHPIAKGIVNEAKKRNITVAQVSEFKSFPGKGIVGKVGSHTYYAGSIRIFEENEIAGIHVDDDGKGRIQLLTPEAEIWQRYRELEKQGKTVVFVGDSHGIIGMISLADTIRNDAKNTIDEIRKMGIKTVMLTGDNEHNAHRIAKACDIDEHFAGLLPEQKVEAVKTLKQKYGTVAMVGDGVNDAPALAQADVGIAMGTIGSDVALESADIALMNDDISKISYLIKLSKKTSSVVRQNIASSISIKGSLAVLAFPGIVTLWMAVAIGDIGLSLAVIANALSIPLVIKAVKSAK